MIPAAQLLTVSEAADVFGVCESLFRSKVMPDLLPWPGMTEVRYPYWYLLKYQEGVYEKLETKLRAQ